jgi:Uma2 family endonuclease
MMSATAPRRYLRPPEPVHFPESAEVPESKWHLELRTALYDILKLAFSDRACIGCDQFVYWDPTSPSACLAPDGFVRFGVPDEMFRTWKVWERGAPHVAVEITSNYDGRFEVWEDKLAKYRRLGVEELVRFDADATERTLQVWDNVEGDLVERELVEPRRAESSVLQLNWVVLDHPRTRLCLRLQDPATGALLPTREERARHQAEASASERIRELQEELARLKSSR